MNPPPRKKEESIFARGLGINALWQGVMFGIITLIAYWLGFKESGGQLIYAQSMAFAVLAISQLVHALNCRSDNSLFVAGWFKNPMMWLAVGGAFALILIIMCVPFMRDIFGLAALNATEFLEIGLLSLVPLVVTEAVKGVKLLVKKFLKN